MEGDPKQESSMFLLWTFVPAQYRADTGGLIEHAHTADPP